MGPAGGGPVSALDAALAVQVTVAGAPVGLAWIGPLAVGGIGAGLDYSAPGNAAVRDRFAVIFYYACFVSFGEILGWNPWIKEQIGDDYNWRMIGGVASLVVTGALLVVFFNRPKKLAARLSGRLNFASTDSDAIKINQTLVAWVAAAAATAPLSGDGGWGHVVELIGVWCTGWPGAVVSWLFHLLGG